MKLASIFSDNMVFAEGEPVRVFGTGEGRVTVCFDGDTGSCVSERKNGRWLVELPARRAGGPYELTVDLDGEKKVFKDVYVGLVVMIAGQSNAELSLKDTNTSAEMYRSDDNLRCFFVDRPWNGREAMASEDGWVKAEKDKVGIWTAIGYLAGRSLRTRTGLPVGVIACYQGACIIEAWLSPAAAKKCTIPLELLHPDHSYPDYRCFNRKSLIYNKMLKTFAPYAFNAFVWYQGESDTMTAEAEVYHKYYADMKRGIKRLFRLKKVDTAIVQIADYDDRAGWFPEGWTALQEAQERAAANDPEADLIVSKDICESSCIHPPTKNALAERIAGSVAARYLKRRKRN